MIFVDVETTGTDQNKHAIASIGAVQLEKPSNTFYLECRAFPGAVIDNYALKINGFTKEQIFKTNDFSMEEAVKVFNDWLIPIRERTIAGENPRFDLDFLRSAYERSGWKWILGYRTIDLHSIAYLYHLINNITIPIKKDSLTSNISLDEILTTVGLPEEPEPHNALTGAKLEAESFSRMVRADKLLEEYSEYPIPENRKSFLQKIR